MKKVTIKMKVSNIHKRTIGQPKSEISKLFSTLCTKEDKMWPWEKWPAMKFKNGLVIGSEGGHGPIRYKVLEYEANEKVVFEFQKPHGLGGIHKFEIVEINPELTEIKHSILINTKGFAIFSWPFAIKSLHNALIEDAFDKIENQFLENTLKSEWSPCVKLLRGLVKPKKKTR